MNMRLASLMLWACATSACAENLPPVDNTGAYPPQAIKPPPPMPSINTLNQMMSRMEQMQKEIQQLTGKVEDQVFLIAELKKQQKTQYADFDERLHALETKGSTTTPDAGAVTPDASVATPPDDTTKPVTDSAPGSSAVVTDSAPGSVAVMPDAAGAAAATAVTPDTAPATGTSPPGTATPGAQPTSSPEPAAAKAPQPEAPIQASEEEKQEYKQAYNQLSTGKTDEAIMSFDAYLAKYPSGGYASNVQYWLGEAYRVKQDNNAAKLAFNKVVEGYPASPKVPDALLKLAYIEIELDNAAKAREYLTRIGTDYPNSNAAYLASKKLATLTDVKP
jgi:tol-pal system protein YbgF